MICPNCKNDMGNNLLSNRILDKLNDPDALTFCSINCANEFDEAEEDFKRVVESEIVIQKDYKPIDLFGSI